MCDYFKPEQDGQVVYQEMGMYIYIYGYGSKLGTPIIGWSILN